MENLQSLDLLFVMNNPIEGNSYFYIQTQGPASVKAERLDIIQLVEVESQPDRHTM